MLIGADITAQEGFGALAKGMTYKFAANAGPLVVLAQFSTSSGNGSQLVPTVTLIRFPRTEFEDGIDRKLINVASTAAEVLPPWLKELSDVNMMRLNDFRQSSKRSYIDYAQSRLLHIAPALENLADIFAAPDMERAINQFANRASPRQNRVRFRLWLLTYLCYGRNVWALLPPFHKLGKREKDFSEVKQGAPSKSRGKNSGYPATRQMVEACMKGYLNHKAPGLSMQEIYVQTMIHVFECKSVGRKGEPLRFVQSEGKPFPTFNQFKYWVEKAISPETVQEERIGPARYRRRKAASKGRFTEEVSTVFEITEFDGHYTAELPKGYIEGKPLPPLCVVTGRDVLTGLLAGIGFSFDESSAAYRMALFSMAVPKKFFCALFGIELEDGKWTNEGLPPHIRGDRGPGSTLDLVSNSENPPAIIGMTPAYSGQSKATIESSHPRQVKFEDAPTHVLSKLTPVELAKKEISRVIIYNNKANMSDRMEIAPELAYVLSTPLAMFEHYDKRMRNSALPVSIAEAVRSFLTPISVVAKKDGVYFNDRRHDSQAFRETGLLDTIARSSQGQVVLKGYMLDLCLRHIWVEVDHTIILLDAMLKTRDDESLLFVSIAELEQWKEARAQVNSLASEHRSAAIAEGIELFEQSTGQRWTAGERRRGAAKKSTQETKEARKLLSPPRKKSA
ncbi:hypothetical protein [Pandoraea pnomenusa]|uniref:hypothetical protein n=1 Tax=Pandoraea pnomenusa TaxID=93220 RepID=UPI00334275EE